jgi:hypothetical protein
LAPEQLGQQLGRALERQVLAVHQVDGKGAHLGSPAHRRPGLGGEDADRLSSTGAPAALGHVVGDAHLDPGDLEHLPADLTDDVRPGQVGAASTAAHRWVHDDLVGDTPGQMRPRGSGLLALAPTGRPPRGASHGP